MSARASGLIPVIENPEGQKTPERRRSKIEIQIMNPKRMSRAMREKARKSRKMSKRLEKAERDYLGDSTNPDEEINRKKKDRKSRDRKTVRHHRRTALSDRAGTLTSDTQL